MSPAGSAVEAISSLIRGARFGLAPDVLTSDYSDAPRILLDGKRQDAITDLARARSFEVYFSRDGRCVIDDARQLVPSTSHAVGGNGGTAASIRVDPDWSRVYNVVTCSSSASNVHFGPVEAAITWLRHPAHPDQLGAYRVFKHSSPNYRTRAQAQKAAATILRRVSGRAESYTYQVIPDPTRDAGDSIRGAISKGWRRWQIQSVTTPLQPGDLSTVVTVNTSPDAAALDD
jgi:hypothetical protein